MNRTETSVAIGAPMPTEPPIDPLRPFVSVTWGLRGWSAVLMWWNPDLDGFWEPWESHPHSFCTEAEAIPIARAWAEAQGVEFL